MNETVKIVLEVLAFVAYMVFMNVKTNGKFFKLGKTINNLSGKEVDKDIKINQLEKKLEQSELTNKLLIKSKLNDLHARLEITNDQEEITKITQEIKTYLEIGE